ALERRGLLRFVPVSAICERDGHRQRQYIHRFPAQKLDGCIRCPGHLLVLTVRRRFTTQTLSRLVSLLHPVWSQIFFVHALSNKLDDRWLFGVGGLCKPMGPHRHCICCCIAISSSTGYSATPAAAAFWSARPHGASTGRCAATCAFICSAGSRS